MSPEKYALLQGLFPLIVTIVAVAVTGWVITTWMRIKHGYPLDGAWGQAVYPQKSDETIERVRLLIGPEGGLSAEEIAMTGERGFTDILLGPRVLRTETTALTAITALQVRFGDLG